MLTLHKLGVVIHQYRTASIAEVVNALAALKYLRFQLRVVRVGLGLVLGLA